MRSPRFYFSASVAATLLLIITPAAAFSCRITNATLWGQGITIDSNTNPLIDRTKIGTDIWVWFDCGAGCGNYYNIQAGKSVAHPKKGGYVQVCTGNGEGGWHKEQGRAKVDPNGEARMKFGTREIPVGSVDNSTDTPYLGSDRKKVHWDMYDVHNNLTGQQDDRTFEADDQGNAGTHSPAGSKACWQGTP